MKGIMRNCYLDRGREKKGRKAVRALTMRIRSCCVKETVQVSTLQLNDIEVVGYCCKRNKCPLGTSVLRDECLTNEGYHLQQTSENIPFRLGSPSPVDTGVPNGLLMLRKDFNDFLFEHRSGCCATEPGTPGILAL